ncbi:hypothetical protein L1987_81658 [Smallanthus sonchifolius]|uniref:Uncharacterized protein n=2 Tax=Smallanthus sonchifolius TaxID=185202 RepID=A0ACB8YRN4_9ASTR|nr:hypothetical protein L1987_81647 [Smallanthus sonchifolius]KAI3687953.1 hypothetical protein L1987_81658 [Smallanthus sonchifolius]
MAGDMKATTRLFLCGGNGGMWQQRIFYVFKDELARGDVPKSVQCYMHESGATEEEARGYIKEMIGDAWKKLNKERTLANSQFSREYIEYAANMARMAQFMYGEGDGHGRPEITKSHQSSLLFNPIKGTK